MDGLLVHIDGQMAFKRILPLLSHGHCDDILRLLRYVLKRFTDRPKMPKSPNMRNAKGSLAVLRWRTHHMPVAIRVVSIFPHDTHIFS